jgi:CMP-N,N'-diacetyllegionaminic acid synthase
MIRILGIIPARGGSKGIPRKNIKMIAEKPLIAWTIESALESHELDRLIISTDDREIANVAKEWGAETPFLRPANISTDTATSFSVVKHTLEWLKNESGYIPDYCMLLQPTSPLRSKEDIRGICDLLRENSVDAIVSVCESPVHPYHIKKILENGTIQNFCEIHSSPLRRQDFPPAVSVNGAIYLNRTSTILDEETFLPENKTYAYVMPIERSLDIDTPWDFHLAELILKNHRE